MAKISVIMSVYNTDEKYLREAIESILNQTYSDFEFIIINDCSTNNAKEVILSYHDSRIKFIDNEKNLGLTASLNLGIDNAKGEYIARMDSDDISFPLRFEKQVQYLNNYPDVGILGTRMQVINYRNNPPTKEDIFPLVADNEHMKTSMVFVQNQIAHPSVMIRKYLFDEYGKYHDKFKGVEDYALWLSLINKTNFKNLEEVLGNYRYHKSNYTYLYHNLSETNALRLRLKYQKEYFNIDTKKVFKPLMKRRMQKKLNPKELNQLIKYYMQILKSKPQKEFKLFSKNQVLMECKRSIFESKIRSGVLISLFNKDLISLVIQKYLCMLRGEKFI